MVLNRSSKTLGSKLAKTNILLEHSDLKELIPETVKYDYKSLHYMLNMHHMVYVKPNKGSQGRGVIKVSRAGDEVFKFHIGDRSYNYSNYDALYTGLDRYCSVQPYIVQKGIELLTYKNRIMDLRIMIQLNEQYEWETTGYVGRVAHRSKIVTNYHDRGLILPLETLLQPYVRGQDQRQLIEQLELLGRTVAKQLQLTHPEFKEIGLDIGLDQEMKPWIIEVNTRPGSIIFKMLRNKRMYRRVRQLKRWHGLRF